MFTTSATCISKEYSQSGDVVIIRFRVEQYFDFQAGQFVLGTFQIQNKVIKRSYSIYSTMVEMKSDSLLALLVKKTSDPYVSQYLTDDIQIWHHVQFTWPLGHLTLQISQPKLLLLSIGSGVTPIASLMQDRLASGDYKQIVNLYGERYRNHIARHTRNLFQTSLPGVNSRIYLSQELAWDGYQVWHIQQWLSDTLPIINQDWTVVICGKPNFVDEMIQILMTHGIQKWQIKSEKY